MSNLAALLSMLGIFIATFFGSYWVNTVINDRGDQILSGVVKGAPVSPKNRRLMLFTQWLPYTAFLIAFLGVVGLGFLEVAREIEHPRAKILGYMCAMMCAGGAVFWGVLGSFLLTNMISVLRETTRP